MKIETFNVFPKPYESYPNILKSIVLGQVHKQLNRFKGRHHAQLATLPDVCYRVEDFQVDANHLANYRLLCGFRDDSVIPSIYLMVLAQSLQMQMMSQEAFPFEILGLVHIANHLTQQRPIKQNEHLTLSCSFGELRPHDKGMQFDFIVETQVNDETVMHAKMTYLSRQKTAKNDQAKITKQDNTPAPAYQLKDCWTLAENLGRRYALNSGDFNFIHLHEKTAKLFGFKRAVAHGMWTNAKALASVTLPEKFEMNAQFKLPIFLPATVDCLTAESTGKLDILVKDSGSEKPHMTAEILG